MPCAAALLTATVVLLAAALPATAARAATEPAAGPTARPAPLRIVAAENFYGDVARQLAGPTAQVTSVLRNPSADPHLFELDVPTARAIAAADLLIYNGAHYDPWVLRLLSSTPSSTRRVIEVAALLHRQGADANPHLWYDPATMPVVARALAAQLQQLDPVHAAAYSARLQRFLESMRALDAQIGQLRRRYAGQPVTATEPVANYLTAAIGLTMREQRFQLAVMNDTEPGARETAAFERALIGRQVRVLIYNQQAGGTAVQRLLDLARRSHVPVVGVTETEPPGVDYQQWMLAQISALGRALSGAAP
ncbi:MAG TPA: zinc ABC transporter substrate-binding protein [Steroidobacteraceae bacterium]|jgi:zinc/manganese transport system substrate-binding protein|nr:zinc ABC transporter substrate-binding protein [Steroidobacteraceae bacterium]